MGKLLGLISSGGYCGFDTLESTHGNHPNPYPLSGHQLSIMNADFV